MPGRIDDARWNKYLDTYATGVSQETAAEKVGISMATIQRQMADPNSRLNNLRGARGELGSGIVPLGRVKGKGAEALDDFALFRTRYLGRGSIPWQNEAAEQVVAWLDDPKGEKTYAVVNAPPGSGKSTFFTHDLLVWLIVRNRGIRILIGSNSEKMAETYTGRIRRTLERQSVIRADPEDVRKGLATDANAVLTRDYGRFKPSRSEEMWARGQFTVAQHTDILLDDKEATVTAFGYDSTFLGGRFDLVIWDDLITKKTLRTQEARENLTHWWETEAETRLEPGGLLILQGQRMDGDDLYRYALDLPDIPDDDGVGEDLDAEALAVLPRKYHHVVYKAHYDDRCVGAHTTDAPPYPDGCLLDPRRVSWRDLQRIRANKEERFLVLYQQEDHDPSTALIQRVWVDGGRGADGADYPGCWDEDRMLGTLPPGVVGKSVITADPSPTRYWSVQWWLYQPDTGLAYLLDMHRAPMDAPDFLDWNATTQSFYGLLEEWAGRAKELGAPVTHVIVETNAAQKFLLQYDHVRRWTQARSITVVPHATAINKGDPDYGVQTLAPEVKYARLRLPGYRYDQSRPTVAPLLKELIAWPNGATDDCVMAWWFLRWNANRLFPKKRPESAGYKRPSWLTGNRWAS